jgi:hypothetical protein
VPVDFLGTGNVAEIEEEHVLITFEEAEGRIAEVLGQPPGADEHLGVAIAATGDRRIGSMDG